LLKQRDIFNQRFHGNAGVVSHAVHKRDPNYRYKSITKPVTNAKSMENAK
jgi:hypothetical protein